MRKPPAVRLLMASYLFMAAWLLSACSTPTLVEVSRRRAAPEGNAQRSGVKDDVTVPYQITDWDVLSYTDEVERKLAGRAHLQAGLRYSSSTAQVTLTSLAAAASTAGWGVSTASGLGLGAGFLYSLSQIFDAKSQSQAYETAFTAIEQAETHYYFHQLGYTLTRGTDGRFHPVRDTDRDPGTYSADGTNIPARNRLTIDGETLYYRVTKVLKVLDDALAQKIPNLQDLQDAVGETPTPGTGTGSKSNGDGRTGNQRSNDPGSGRTRETPGASTSLSGDPASTQNGAATHPGTAAAKHPPGTADNAGRQLEQFGWPGGTENGQNVTAIERWMAENEITNVDVTTFLQAAQYAQQRQAAVAALKITSVEPHDPTTLALQRFCWPNGTQNDQNVAALRAWIANHPSAPTGLTIFVYAPQYSAQRQQAVNDLGLSKRFVSDAASVTLRKYGWPANVADAGHLKNLRDWMTSNGLTDVKFSSFLYTAPYAAQRQAAVASLKL